MSQSPAENQSLSIILPVCNAESKLARVVHQLLEVTSDLASNLELMIVDDGSTDDTAEIAMELCRQYPQVKTMRYAAQAGHIHAVRTGLVDTRGDVVLIQNVNAPISSEAIRQLWTMRNEEDTVFSRSEPAHEETPIPVMHGKPTWSGGTQMLRREALRQMFEDPAPAHVPPAEPVTPDVAANRDSATSRVTRKDDVEKSMPTIFQQHSSAGMQPDR